MEFDNTQVDGSEASTDTTPSTPKMNNSATLRSRLNNSAAPLPPPQTLIFSQEKNLFDSLALASLAETNDNNSNQPAMDISDFECSLCFRLFCKPVSTQCGHTYCRNCLLAALKFNPCCPLCRTKLEDPAKFKYSVNIVLLNVLDKHFKEPYTEREREEDEEEAQQEQIENLKENAVSGVQADLEEYYSSWSSCLLPPVRATCCVLLSCT